MLVYVVTCFMEGCEECGNSYHVVGVASTREKAEELEKLHQQNEKHIHFSTTDVDEMEVIT